MKIEVKMFLSKEDATRAELIQERLKLKTKADAVSCGLDLLAKILLSPDNAITYLIHDDDKTRTRIDCTKVQYQKKRR